MWGSACAAQVPSRLRCLFAAGSVLILLACVALRSTAVADSGGDTSVQVLEKNTVYRVGDIVHHTGIKWRRDSIAILTQPEFRKLLLWDFLASTSRYNATRLSKLSPAQLQALLERAQGVEKELRSTHGESGIDLEPSRQERVHALAHSVKHWLDEERCTRAPPATSVIHLRLGDKLADMAPETETKYSPFLLRDIASLACTGDSVVLNGVMHFGPISADLVDRHPWMRQTSTFEFSEAKRARNERFISSLRSKLGACGVQYAWRSQPSVDEDICFLSTADRFVESIGGYSKLITSIRKDLGTDARRKATPPNRQCRRQLVQCLGAEAVGDASAQTLTEVYKKASSVVPKLSPSPSSVAASVEVLPPTVTHQLDDVTVTIAVWPTYKPWNVSASCQTRMVGDAHGMLDVGVTVCPHGEGQPTRAALRRAPPAGKQLVVARPVARGRRSMALCIPPLYGTPRMTHLRKHLSFYKRAHEFTHTYVYATSDTTSSAANLSTLANTTVLSMPWAMTLQLHSRAQNFMENDCVHRAAAHGLVWALSVDIDEFLVLASGVALRVGLQGLLQEAKKAPRPHARSAVDVLTFGAVWVRRFHYDGRARNWEGTVHCSDNFEGLLYPLDDPRAKVCPSHAGRRKHLVRTQHMWAVNIHFARSCREGLRATACAVTDMSTDEARLLHIGQHRGEAQSNARAKGGRYAACPTCPRVGVFVANRSSQRSPPSVASSSPATPGRRQLINTDGELRCTDEAYVWITVGSADRADALSGARPPICHEHLVLPATWMKQFARRRHSFWRNRWLLVQKYLLAHKKLRLAILTDAYATPEPETHMRSTPPPLDGECSLPTVSHIYTAPARVQHTQVRRDCEPALRA